MKDIIEKLKGMDKSQLKNAVKQARAFAKTTEGRDLVEKIKNGKAGVEPAMQNNIMKELGKNPDMAKLVSDIFNSEG